jgi:ribose transport system substrate-binding protein
MYNRRKALSVFAIATSIVIGAAGCGDQGSSSSSSGASGSSGDKKTVAIISKGYQHQFWQAVKKGAEAKGKELNVTVTFEGPDKETNVDQQVTMLQSALDKKPGALGIAALDSKAVAPLLEQAKSANIPVVAFDSGVESDIPVATAATDNKAAAAEAAKHLAEAIGHKGKIAVVTHSDTSTTGVDRKDGFVEYIKANEPNIEIVAQQNGDGDQAKSADITKAILQANPDIVGLYGTNEGAAIGVVQGVKELGKKGLKIVGFDSGKAQIDAIKAGEMVGAVTQNPVAIGAVTVQTAVDAMNGKTVEKKIDTGFKWYDKSTIDNPEIAELLYQ